MTPPPTIHIDPATGLPTSVAGIDGGTVTVTGNTSSGTNMGSSLFDIGSELLINFPNLLPGTPQDPVPQPHPP